MELFTEKRKLKLTFFIDKTTYKYYVKNIKEALLITYTFSLREKADEKIDLTSVSLEMFDYETRKWIDFKLKNKNFEHYLHNHNSILNSLQNPIDYDIDSNFLMDYEDIFKIPFKTIVEGFELYHVSEKIFSSENVEIIPLEELQHKEEEEIDEELETRMAYILYKNKIIENANIFIDFSFISIDYRLIFSTMDIPYEELQNFSVAIVNEDIDLLDEDIENYL